MEFMITALNEREILVCLEEVEKVFLDDDVVYFCGIPCRLSTARYLRPGEREQILRSTLVMLDAERDYPKGG